MPRLNLSDEEAKLILRIREVEDARTAGWNKALQEIERQLTSDEELLTHNQILAIVRKLQQ